MRRGRKRDWAVFVGGIAAFLTGLLVLLVPIGVAFGKAAFGVAKHVWPYGLVAIGFAALVRPLVLLDFVPKRRASPEPRRLRTISAWAVAAGIFAVIALGTGAVLWLLSEADRAKPDDRATLRIDAIKTGLTVAAGAGGAAALLLTARRQWLAERAQAHTEDDAAERRVTELYSKAVEQLGSDRALVRLGALYALERLAQGNPRHRQTVVNVICAYLRMPFPYPLPAQDPSELSQVSGSAIAGTADRPEYPEEKWREDMQVRMAAQRILTGHLTAREDAMPDQLLGLTQGPDELLWLHLGVDLSQATLIDVDLRRCHLEHATFTGASFHGRSMFSDGFLSAGAGFNKAVFHGPAFFVRTTFREVALFKRTEFCDYAAFSEAVFMEDAAFGSAQFRAGARFDRATFERGAGFDKIVFARPLQMANVRVRRQARYGHTWPSGWHLHTAGAEENYGLLTTSGP